MAWDSEPLEAAVRAKHGDSVADSLKVPARSIHWKIKIGNYHACESRRLLENLTPATVFEPERLFAEAHMIAAAQSLHSTADIMANVVYWALNLQTDPSSPPLDYLHLSKLKNYEKGCQLYKPVFTAIKNLFEFNKQFKYLEAYVNTTKHRRLVKESFEMHLVNNRQDFIIESFKHNDDTYDELRGEQFLREDAQKVQIGVLAIGNALNAHYGITI